MDFSQFLDTGELSDVTVTVDNRDFLLHKFPLFIKSDYFRELAQRRETGNGASDGTNNKLTADSDMRISLPDFPGGPETFQLVASYCYNVRIDVNKRNVCLVRCAAEYLKMNGTNNLSGLTDRVLNDTLTAAKVRRKLDIITQLLAYCQRLGPLAEQANIVSSCLDAILDSWLIPTASKFTRLRYGDRSSSRSLFSSSSTSLGPEVMHKLVRLPLRWFMQLLRQARDRCVDPAIVTTLIERYLSQAVDRRNGVSKKANRRTQNESGNNDDVTETGIDDGQVNDRGRRETVDSDSEESEASDKEHDGEVQGSSSMERTCSESHAAARARALKMLNDADEDVVGDDLREPDDELTDSELCDIFDSLLLSIPSTEYPLAAEVLRPRWITYMLARTELIGCSKSRDVLLKLASFVAHRFSAEELSQLEPDTFIGLIRAACESVVNVDIDGPSATSSYEQPVTSSQVCRAVDAYLKAFSDRGDLTVDTFRRIVDAIPEQYRTSDDTFFEVIQTLLSSDKMNDVNDADRQSLLQAIDYKRLGESSLQAALDSKLVPATFIAQAALNLCAKLRTDLEAANSAIRLQHQKPETSRASSWGPSCNNRALTGGHGGLGTGSIDQTKYGTRYTHKSPTGFYLPTTTSLSVTRPSYRSTGTGSAVYDHRKRPHHQVTTSNGSTSAISSGVGSSSYRSTIPSLSSHLELQLALEPLIESTKATGSDNDGIGSGLSQLYYPDVISACNGNGEQSLYGLPQSATNDYFQTQSVIRSVDPTPRSTTSRAPYMMTSSIVSRTSYSKRN